MDFNIKSNTNHNKIYSTSLAFLTTCLHMFLYSTKWGIKQATKFSNKYKHTKIKIGKNPYKENIGCKCSHSQLFLKKSDQLQKHEPNGIHTTSGESM